MKIALLGGMVNNLYAISKILSSRGFDITYIRDLEDCFLSHQPFWLDKRLEIPSKDLTASNIESALGYDKKFGWDAPEWYLNPLDFSGKLLNKTFNHIGSPLNRFLFKRRYQRSNFWKETLEALQEVDMIFACGIFPALLARLSSKPYVLYAYGGDIRFLRGQEPVPSAWKDRAYHSVTRRLAKDAYENALGVGFSYTKNIYCLQRSDAPEINFTNSFLLPFPAFSFEERSYKPQILKKKGVIRKSKINVLIPSRIDFHVKGHDKLLKAMMKLPSNHRFHFIFLGWGKDLKGFTKKIAKSPLLDSVTVLGGMLSRPLLWDCMHECDLVIDQFSLGCLGTSALETLGMGKPLMMWVDSEKCGYPKVPPIFNCSSEEEIFDTFMRILREEVDLKRLGDRGRSWALKYHGNDIFVDALKGVL